MPRIDHRSDAAITLDNAHSIVLKTTSVSQRSTGAFRFV